MNYHKESTQKYKKSSHLQNLSCIVSKLCYKNCMILLNLKLKFSNIQLYIHCKFQESHIFHNTQCKEGISSLQNQDNIHQCINEDKLKHLVSKNLYCKLCNLIILVQSKKDMICHKIYIQMDHRNKTLISMSSTKRYSDQSTFDKMKSKKGIQNYDFHRLTKDSYQYNFLKIIFCFKDT